MSHKLCVKRWKRFFHDHNLSTKQNYSDHNETLSLLNSFQKMFELCLDSSSKSKLD